MTNSPRSALITGGAGFIGSHLSEALLHKGWKVTVIDDLSTGRFANIEHLARNHYPQFRFAIDTIANESVLDRVMSECDIVFHLAAAVGVKLIVERPVHTIEANVLGTEAVLRAALRYRAKLLLASTSEVYGKGNHLPFREDDDVVLGPTSRCRWAYAASKMVDEFLTLAYHAERGLPVVIFRLFNTVGPRQSGRYGMVIPRFVQQALAGKPLTVYGDGHQTRCFMNVHDAVRALISLAECPHAIGEVFNIGSTESISIIDLAYMVLEVVEEMLPARSFAPIPSAERITFVPYSEAYTAGFEDMRHRAPDITKIHALTGWKPEISLRETIREVVQYYLERSEPASEPCESEMVLA